MKKLIFLVFLGICYTSISTAQKRVPIIGFVKDYSLKTPLKKVHIRVLNTAIETFTDPFGKFQLDSIMNYPFVLEFNKEGYELYNVTIQEPEEVQETLELVYLKPLSNDEETPVYDLNSLKEEPENSDFIAGLFHSSKDSYQRVAAFNFGQVWFKIRGYDSSYGKILINGIEMNKHFDNRAQWSNWGGLNEVFRNQQFSSGIGINDLSFGGLLGTTNFVIKSSSYRPGKSLTYSSTNKSYTNRVMATYVSGLNKNGWAMVASGSLRYAKEGFMDGTPYDAWSGFLSVEKKINQHHSLNLVGIASSNTRGKSSPNTQEVVDLRGITYNSYWGSQVGKIRNSRMKNIFEPLILFSHFYNGQKIEIKTSLSYQFGHIGNTRLGNFKVKSPDPTYYKYLPSYYLSNPDRLNYTSAYLANQQFLQDGQINWEERYVLNSNEPSSLSYLYEDRNDNTQISGNLVLRTAIKDQLFLTVGTNYSNVKSVNYAKMLDLMGGKEFIDLNPYGHGNSTQQNLENPNRSIMVGDKFQYSFDLNSNHSGLFIQLESRGKKVEYFGSGMIRSVSFQRNGHYKNGSYETNSLGKSEKVTFNDFSIKGGVTFKITGRHVLNIKGALLNNAPRQKVVFSNARVSNSVSPNVTSESIQTADLNYLFRSQKIQARLTGYFTQFYDQSRSSFYFAQGLFGDQSHFVNEIVTGISKKHVGLEWSFDYQFLSDMKLILAGSIGDFYYSNNPRLILQSENLTTTNIDFGLSYLRNYKISGTPHRGYSMGIEYRDPDYWWFQLNGNYLSHHFIDVSPVLRTENFYLDNDGIPFVNPYTGKEIQQNEIDDLLKQEQFDPVFLLNVIGGKSWKIDDLYIGLFLGINNVLGTVFKTGGFEQSRKANFLEYNKDKHLNQPVFGPKYWYGNRGSYFLNLSVKF